MTHHPASSLRRDFLIKTTWAAATLGAGPLCAQSVPAPSPGGSGAAFTLGVLPNISARVLLTHYQPMREYLQQSLGRPVDVVTATDFRAFAQATRAGKYDMVVTAPNLGRMAQLDSRWLPVAQYEPGIPALLVASAQRDTPIAELRGKALALGNPQSLVALVGLRWLGGQGLSQGRDFKVVQTPNDDSLGAVILSGEAPFAIMSMGEFKAKPEALRQSLRIVSQFAVLPGFWVMLHPDTSPADQQKMGAALKALPASDAGKRFFGLSGFTNIRPVVESELAELDAYVETTRRALLGGN